MDQSKDESRNALFNIINGHSRSQKEDRKIIPKRDQLFELDVDQISQLCDQRICTATLQKAMRAEPDSAKETQDDTLYENSTSKSSSRLTKRPNNLFQNSIIQESLANSSNNEIRKGVVFRKTAQSYYSKPHMGRSTPVESKQIKSIHLPNIINCAHMTNSMFNRSKVFKASPKIVIDSNKRRINHLKKCMRISSKHHSMQLDGVPHPAHLRSISVSHSKGSVMKLKMPLTVTKSLERTNIKIGNKHILPTPNRQVKQSFLMNEDRYEGPKIQTMSFGKPIFQIY
ncbi:unnamed protein product [Moneuplotes crassus]|uniref:Uncharacterized protein n=1 Tax=Euplotes crassus TaxID=5936 RepID=A0AAD1UNB6_EUPCR|nr:unnamed protein product [Moneuplotes crassus]